MPLFVEDDYYDDYPDELLGHDDRCNFPAGAGCSCAEWERFDEERAEREAEQNLCDMGEVQSWTD